jgi:hypothetical protein
MTQSRAAQDMANYGFMACIAGAVLWLLIGLWQISEYFRQNDLLSHPPAPDNVTPDTMFLSILLGGTFIAFALIGFVLSILVRWKILEPLGRQEYEYAARYINIFGALQLLFGFGLGGALLLLSYIRMKDTIRDIPGRQQSSTFIAQATPLCPTCGTPARFVHGDQKWHCDKCARFL